MEASQRKESKILVSFQGRKVEFLLQEGLTPSDVKRRLIESEQSAGNNLHLVPPDIKLIFKGRSLTNDKEELLDTLEPLGKSLYKIMAVGRSLNEVDAIQGDHAEAMKRVPRIRDDLTHQGQREMEQRKRLGRQLLQKASQKQQALDGASSQSFGFGQIETLPNLPEEAKAREILTQLASDPGVLACMKKHNWKVGSLAELYPEGKVGESEVCVMGLNRNKGRQILLRIRTDDLHGFRKILSIRKVLFHELAHNEFSGHDGNFFQLMRQIEKESNELDWTKGNGLSSAEKVDGDFPGYAGGTYRLGGSSDGHDLYIDKNDKLAAREICAQAALSRMTAEEEEIQQHCGCGKEAKFLPAKPHGNVDQGSANDTTDMDTS